MRGPSWRALSVEEGWQVCTSNATGFDALLRLQIFRSPPSADDAKVVHTNAVSFSNDGQHVEHHDETQVGGGSMSTTCTVSGPAAAAPNAANGPPNLLNRRTDSKIVIDELLTYAVYYHDRYTVADLHKLIAHL